MDVSNSSTPRVSIIVVSFDGYSDLWDPFFQCFFKFWPDCPYPIHLGCGHATFDREGVAQIKVGADVDYSSNILTMLRRVESPLVILWTDDFFLHAPVKTPDVQRLVAVLKDGGVGYVDLLRFPSRISSLFSKPSKFEGLNEMPKGAPYRTSLGVTLWRRDFLMRFLRPGDSAWDVERQGGDRADAFDESFLCVGSHESQPPVNIVNMIERKALTRNGSALLRREGLTGHLRERPLESAARFAKMCLYRWLRYVFVYTCTIILGTARTTTLVRRIVRSGALSIQN
jgi:hypothetical protein